MLLTGLIVGILSTVALVWTSVLASPAGPPPGSPQNPAPQPPPPHSEVLVIVSSAFFVVGWVIVAVAVARDFVVRRLADAAAQRTQSLVDMHDQLNEQMSTLREISEQIETNVFINGLNARDRKPDGPGGGRPLKTVPPPE
jgi:hypothetical protein